MKGLQLGATYAQQGPFHILLFVVHPDLPVCFSIIDAEECWVQMLTALKDVPGLPGPSAATESGGSDAPQSGAAKKFVEQFMTGEMRRE